MTVPPKNPEELVLMRRSGAILNDVHKAAYDFAVAGVSLKAIDQYIHQQITKAGGAPSFLHYRGYPASSCLSVNDAVVHGIPTDYVLEEGDILGIDIGVNYEGYHTDAAITKPIGKVPNEVKTFLSVTQEALRRGVEAAIAGNCVSDIGSAVHNYVQSAGKYGIVRELAGHGVGRKLQELPEIMNIRNDNTTPLVNDMTLAIEPMLTTGHWQVEIASDKWTVLTKDMSLAAQFETTIIVHGNDPEVLVPFPLDVQL